MEIKNLEKLYMHELKDLYSVESQQIDELANIHKKATNECLANQVEELLSQSKQHKERIEKIMKNYDHEPTGHKCKGMEGILAEATEALSEAQGDGVTDAMIISMCGRMKHYELAGYGTARAFAECLNKTDEADLLLKSMNEDSSADQSLSTLGWRGINRAAKSQNQGNSQSC